MVFSSGVFVWLFLPLVFLINYFIKSEYSNFFLLAASLIFYAWGEPYLVLLMILSILVNHFVGVCISKYSDKKKMILAGGVIFDLGCLFYFKYLGLFVDLINYVCGGEILPPFETRLPIGISFFTFQAISYIVDVYRGEVETQNKPVNTALYISFFPQLIAGPIVKYKDINKQIESREVTGEGVAYGFRRFVYGFAKKILIANTLGECVDVIFALDVTSFNGALGWAGIVTYAFQLYYDFSGYSDMAIGLGRMFGFTIPENFQYPYISRSITEYWRRWHISLGTWFREYLYIPLGGNRKGVIRTYINLVIIFLMTGFWHGGNWSYLCWGAYQGFFMVIEKLGFKKKVLDKLSFLSWLYFFAVTNLGLVIFKMENTVNSLRVCKRMIMPWKYKDIEVYLGDYINRKQFWILIIAIIGSGFLQMLIPEKVKKYWDKSILQVVYVVILFVLCMASLAGDSYNPFIYFQF